MSKNTPEELFDAWAIQGIDEEFALGSDTSRQFLLHNLPTVESFLELGCSNGWVLREVMSKRQELKLGVGIDISSRMIYKAKNWFLLPELVAKKIDFVATDLLTYTPNKHFDVVYSFAVLYYVIPMENLKDSLPKWLKPGGTFIAGTDYYLENAAVCSHWPDMMNIEMDRLRSRDEWKDFFAFLGLQDIRQITLFYPSESNSKGGDQGSLFTIGTYRK
eukprot:TRINITY_DN5116_c1_g1_i1.p1 TRINITY_DN5116_c1_g1~~TRINITY_DN5116_c1_g1_i1.p1  ORF type:complete len:218 (+),score=22.66 TRINITY_DN5116_c1_g1_i1:146-799(+)